MSKNDNLDLDNDNINEPINPEEALSKLGVGSASAEKSVKHNRKAPRRNGKGVNQNMSKAKTHANKAPVNDSNSQAPAPVADDFGQDFGGEKSLMGRRIIDFMKVAKPFAIFSAILTLEAVYRQRWCMNNLFNKPKFKPLCHRTTFMTVWCNI